MRKTMRKTIGRINVGFVSKKIASLMLMTTVLFASVPTGNVYGDTEYYYNDYFCYSYVDDDSVKIEYLVGDADFGETLEIPESINGKTVVEINSIYNDDVKKVIIPGCVKSVGRIMGDNIETVEFLDGIKELGRYSLANDYNLKTVVLPDSLEKIGEGVFYNCSSLKNIDFYDGLKEIGEKAFSYCSSIENIIIPDTCKVSGNESFSFCTNLKSVKIPDNMLICNRTFYSDPNLSKVEFYESEIPLDEGTTEPFVGEYAFFCTSVEEMTIPEGYTRIGTNAFTGCLKLKKIDIPESVKYIGVYTFAGCEALESMVIRGQLLGEGGPISADCSKLKELTLQSTKSIRDYHFLGMEALERIVLPEGLEEIGTASFDRSLALESVVLPDSLKTLGTASFADCASLKTINLPKNLESIQPNTFYHCPSLKNITVDKDNENFVVYKNSVYTKDMKKLVLYNPASTERVIKILPGVEEIGEGVFQYFDNVEEIIIPSSVTTMGEGCVNSNVTIYGKYEQAGYQYAMENGNEFVVIPDGLDTTYDVYVDGFQINPFNYGVRTIYVYPKVFCEEKVVERGLVYGLKKYCDDYDVYVGSSCEDVYSYKATEKGNTASMFIDSDTDNFNYETNDKYVMTMLFDEPFANSAMYMDEIYVRPYIKLADGSFYYGECAEFSFFDLAEKLYKSSQMSNVQMHNALYDNILSKLKPGYSKVIYGEK
ncbi:MAG: leucine-rich repeat domain-containing protein [Lachnospiraceae bacterium]|nr:leucine-rich repeat domain-containing protein [Lachnospiraceae bacterium]